MGYEELIKGIKKHMEAHPFDADGYEDFLGVLREWNDATEDKPYKHGCRSDARHEENRWLQNRIQCVMPLAPVSSMHKLYGAYKQSLCWEATVCFDSYLRYIEIESPPEKQFYKPRRHYLRPIVDGYQRVLDGEIQLLTVSLPKRAGKSQLGINFVCMLSGRRPGLASLMEGAGESLITSFYDGILEYVQQPTQYLFYDIFPESPLNVTGAKDHVLDMGPKERFKTVMCRSIDAKQIGLSEATNVLYLDDCVDGREEAKNRERLDQKWEVISGDVIGRALEGTPIVATGTRYSLYDPIGRLQEFAVEKGWKWESFEVPALDPVTDESNYEYFNPKTGRKQFTTAFFRDQRDMLTEEQFESEFQQHPFEAKGQMFSKKDLNYFFEPPIDKDPDAVMAIGDTAESGEDSTCVGVFAIYGNEYYLLDVVHDNAGPEHTKPKVAKLIMNNHAGNGLFESNNAGQYYARDVDDILKQSGYAFSMRTKRTVSNKKTRIELASDGIKKRFWFRDPSTYERSSDYASFMKELTQYTRTGKVKHDDAPDMCSMAENEFRMLTGAEASAFDRPF